MNVMLQEGAILPAKGTTRSAGYDLYAYEDMVVPPGTQKKVGTGVHVQMPRDIQGVISHRSGMNSKQGIMAYGVVDPDYIGELKVTLFNMHPSNYTTVKKGDRIAQVVFTPFWSPALNEVTKLVDTFRGTGGHGSTGV